MPTKKLPKRNTWLNAKLFLPVLFLILLLAPSLVQAQTSTTIINRPIRDFLTLWGNEDAWISKTKENGLEGLKKAGLNGIGYLGPKIQDGYDKDGNLKKVSAVISLTIDTSKRRAWNMVASEYRNWTDALSNRVYLRLRTQSFVVRIYQKDSSGNPINISLANVPVCSFLSCENGLAEEAARKALAKQGKPSDRILKYRSGSAFFAGAPTDTYEDGYRNGPTGDTPLSTGAAAGTGAAIGSFVPGIGTVTGAIIGVVANALIDTDGPVLILRQTAVVELPVNSSLERDRLTYMELWYAGQQRETTAENSAAHPAGYPNEIPVITDPSTGDTANDRIKYLPVTGDGEGLPYFQIGGVFEFKTPQNFEDAQNQSAQANQEAESIGNNLATNDNRVLPICNITPVGEGSVMGCVAQILYHGIFRPVAFFAQLMGKIFDFFLGYSLSDESYRHEFIQTGWQLVRDISNIFFILVMVWSGLVAVFNTSNVSYKKVVPALIINALIINFSLFATRIVIDISNITARIFYNQMVVKVGGEVQDPSKSAGGYKPISEAIVSSFNPQSIFQGSVLTIEGSSDKGNKSAGEVNFNSQQNQMETTKFDRGSREYAGYFSLVTLVAIAISFAVGMMFWKTAFIFIGRVIGLYVAMIFSPFAFLSRGNIPLVSKIEGINFSSWWGELFKYALLAPIFVFFLFILNSFLNVEFFTKVGLNQNGQGFFGSVMYVMIPMLIIYGLLNKAVGLAKKYSGEFGEMAQKFAVNTTKIAGGVALGTAGFAARTGMGVASKTFGTWAAANKDKNILASGANRFLQWGQKSSLDIRNTKAFNALGGLGIKTDDKFASALGIGQKDALKGNVGLRKERQEKKDKKDAEKHDMSHLTDAQVKKVWEKMSERKAEAEAEKKWEEGRTKELKDAKPELKVLEEAATDLSKKLEEAIKSKNTDEEKSLKEQIKKNDDEKQAILKVIDTKILEEKKDDAHHKTKEYEEKLKKAKSDIETRYGKVESAKELSAAMRYDYAKRMLEDSLLLSDGKKRSGMWALGGLLGGSGGALGNNILKQLALGMSTGGASIIGGVIGANAMDDAQEAALSVNKKFIKEFEKAHDPKKNRIVKLEKELTEIDQLINSHVDRVLSETKESLEGLSEKEKEKRRKEIFDNERGNMRADADIAGEAYNKFKKEYADKKDAYDKETKEREEKKLKDLSNAYRKAKDEADAMDGAHDERDWTLSEIEKEKEKIKNAEDKKKGGGGESSKPKEEK